MRCTEESKAELVKGGSEHGRIGYVVLYFLGVPVGFLILMWAVLGDYIFKAG